MIDTELDRVQGTTARQRRYCIEHGLRKIRDRHFIWKPSKIHRIYHMGRGEDPLDDLY